ncbi:YvfG protein [Scopulibacillus darangshiensis]|uniref:YvfG protein n=1 Tax=Scopulibacillus darangshiensis TaxID=442528 RepID=A0A4R2NB19_9BACL|nr:protein YvfG [Scopulibacillus darangshiensis]TCP18321.1 YvfG protein [Scopulibacillus darangshiensis]
MANTDKFSVDYFKEALRVHIEKSKDVLNPVQAANSYYRSVVSTIIHDHLNKNFELVRRIRNLDEAYNNVKAEYQK